MSCCRHSHGHADTVWLRVRHSHWLHVCSRHRVVYHPHHPHLYPCRSSPALWSQGLFLWWHASEFYAVSEHYCLVQVVLVHSATFCRVKITIALSKLFSSIPQHSVVWRQQTNLIYSLIFNCIMYCGSLVKPRWVYWSIWSILKMLDNKFHTSKISYLCSRELWIWKGWGWVREWVRLQRRWVI